MLSQSPKFFYLLLFSGIVIIFSFSYNIYTHISESRNCNASTKFIDATPPFRPPVKINGVVVEDVGTLEWAFFAKPPSNHQNGWHIRLPHPSNNPNHWYYYYLQSDYAKHHSLCHTCHQHKPTVCKVKGKGCKERAVRNQVRDGHRATLAMPSRTSISLAQISSSDPNVYATLEHMQQRNNSRRR